MVEERWGDYDQTTWAITDQTSIVDIVELEATAAIVVQSLGYRVIRNRRSFAREQ